jgi:hypothetical protein
MATQPAPTQTRHPWRATLRTVVQVGIGLASLAPTIAAVGGLENLTATPAVAQVLAVCAVVTRIMAIPGVNDLLRKVAPFLATDPKAPTFPPTFPPLRG